MRNFIKKLFKGARTLVLIIMLMAVMLMAWIGHVIGSGFSNIKSKHVERQNKAAIEHVINLEVSSPEELDGLSKTIF